LHVSEGITEIVTVTDVPGQGRALMTNGHLMSGTNADSQRYMRAFAHLPLLSMDAPERVVVICFGVGNTLHAASLHPSVRRLEVVRAFVEVFPKAVLLSGTMTDFILMGTNGPRLELQPAKLRARLAGAPAVRDDMRAIGLGSLVEIAGTFAGSAETLARATDIYPPLTDDYPITEYAKVSRLRADQVPVDLFDVRTVTAWCPSCFVNGAPAAGLEG